MQNIIIDLIINDEKWKTENIFQNYKKVIENIVKESFVILKIVLPEDSAIEFSVVLTNNTEIQELNKQYRGKDKPTNVLSFQVIENHLNDEIAKQPYLLLGDIFVSLNVLKQEAKEQGKSIQNHFTHLCLHSFLHLLGYDHMNDIEADEMESLEVKVLEKIGIKNPY